MTVWVVFQLFLEKSREEGLTIPSAVLLLLNDKTTFAVGSDLSLSVKLEVLPVSLTEMLDVLGTIPTSFADSLSIFVTETSAGSNPS